MKLLHTSDWHVGRKIRGRSRADEHRAVLAEITEVADNHKIDLTIVAGDLFDTSAPSPEDESIVYRALLDLAEKAPVVVVAGNHDSAARLEAVAPVMDLGQIHIVGSPQPPGAGGVLVLEDLATRISMLPFVSQRGIVKAHDLLTADPDQHAQDYEGRLRRIIELLTDDMTTDTVNILAGHLTVYGAAPGGGERKAHIFGYAIPPQAFPGSMSYVALGHLHRQQKIPATAPVWYSGSPIQLDFGERDDQKGVLIVDVEPGKPAAVEPVPITRSVPLVQVEGTLEQVEAMAGDLEGCYVKVILNEKARADLNDQVRAAIPGTVDVVLRSEEVKAQQTVSRQGRSPRELFVDYLNHKQVEDPEVVALFESIEEEITS